MASHISNEVAALLWAALLAGPASAAGFDSVASDAPVVAPAVPAAPVASSGDWSGLFVGANLGFSIFDGESDRRAAFGPVVLADIRNGLFLSSIDDLATSIAGGIALGYDYQRGNLVVGVELGLSAVNQGADLSFSAIDPEIIVGATTTSTYRTDIDRLATLRLRAGIAQGRNLYFATAGLATAEVTNDLGLSIDLIGFDSNWRDSGDRHGYIMGIGYERMVSERLSIRAEVSYFDLEDVTLQARDAVFFPNNGLDYEFQNDGAIASIGVNYRF